MAPSSVVSGGNERSRTPDRGIRHWMVVLHFLNVSVPGPPMQTSEPVFELPLSVSLPPPPTMQSVPPFPFRVDAVEGPRMRSLPAVPFVPAITVVRLSAAQAAGLRALALIVDCAR